MEQSPSTLSVQEGNSSVITCTYTDGNSDYFPWYKQEPGKGPQLLIAIRSNKGKEEDQRLTVLLNKTAKHLSLHIATTEARDSAVYFCAARTQCFPGIFCLYSYLWLGAAPFLWCKLQVWQMLYCLLAGGNWCASHKKHVKESESHSVVSNSLLQYGLYSPWDSPGQSAGMGSIFPTQGSNPGPPHCRWILYQLSHRESPRILEWVAYPFSRGSSRPRNRTEVSSIAGDSLPTELSGKP